MVTVASGSTSSRTSTYVDSLLPSVRDLAAPSSGSRSSNFSQSSALGPPSRLDLGLRTCFGLIGGQETPPSPHASLTSSLSPLILGSL